MSHLAHEVCGADFFISFNKCNPLVNELIEGFKRFLKRYLFLTTLLILINCFLF
jgi:hypothetical protein